MNRSGIALPGFVLAFLSVCARTQTASITGTGVPQAALQFDNLYFLGAANNTAFLHTDSFTTVGSSIYNALQMNITKRLSHGQSTEEVTRPDGTSRARQVQFGLKFQF